MLCRVHLHKCSCIQIVLKICFFFATLPFYRWTWSRTMQQLFTLLIQKVSIHNFSAKLIVLWKDLIKFPEDNTIWAILTGVYHTVWKWRPMYRSTLGRRCNETWQQDSSFDLYFFLSFVVLFSLLTPICFVSAECTIGMVIGADCR